LAARNAYHGCAAFVYGAEALFGSELLLEDVRRILDLAASGACQVAAEEWFQHEHKRIALAPLQLLFEDVSGYRPHLRDWSRQIASLLFRASVVSNRLQL